MKNGENIINQFNKKQNSTLQDYEIEISDKKSFITSFFKNLKKTKTPLLLNPGKNAKQSTDLMWRVTGYKANIFDKFDVLRSRGYIRNYIDKFIYQVVGKEKSKNELEIASNKIAKLIVPKNVGTKKSGN